MTAWRSWNRTRATLTVLTANPTRFVPHSQSYRFGGHGQKRVRQTKSYANYMSELRSAFKEGWGDRPMLEGSVGIDIQFYYPGAADQAEVYEHRVGTPDWDNLGKPVSDALQGIAFKDDRQVVDAHVARYRCRGQEGFEVKVYVFAPHHTHY